MRRSIDVLFEQVFIMFLSHLKHYRNPYADKITRRRRSTTMELTCQLNHHRRRRRQKLPTRYAYRGCGAVVNRYAHGLGIVVDIVIQKGDHNFIRILLSILHTSFSLYCRNHDTTAILTYHCTGTWKLESPALSNIPSFEDDQESAANQSRSEQQSSLDDSNESSGKIY